MPVVPGSDLVTGLFRTVRVLAGSGLLAPLRPDKYLRMAAAVRRESVTATTGITLAAVRCPDRTALVDERGGLTWSELAARCDALAAGLAATPGGPPRTVAVLCRNHRGFVEALAAAGRIGADTLLLNTGFAGPQLVEVLRREGADLIVHDEEFTPLLDGAPEVRRLLAWVDTDPGAGPGTGPGADPDGDPGAGGRTVDGRTVDGLIAQHRGRRAPAPSQPGRIVLLTSGTTGTPKGARRAAGGDASTLVSMLARIPWHTEETVVVAAPMFHAWGFGQLLIAATMSCTVVLRRRFDPEAVCALVATHRAAGLALVPVMLERIVDLPAEVRRRYDLRSLRFVTASGSRMRPDAVTTFSDEVGDVIYNSYNGTEVGMVTAATPADLRAAPDTAGRPVDGTELRILDEAHHPVPEGGVGRIFVRNGSQFDGYTGGGTKDVHEGFMSTGDVGRLDAAGRLFVVGRDDEMIVSGGENVYPLEVEESLAGHGAVREAAVVGVDDERFGQALEAFVVLNPGADASPDTLRGHVRERLAGYKVPRRITVLDELPRNTTGKILKRELVERAGS